VTERAVAVTGKSQETATTVRKLQRSRTSSPSDYRPAAIRCYSSFRSVVAADCDLPVAATLSSARSERLPLFLNCS